MHLEVGSEKACEEMMVCVLIFYFQIHFQVRSHPNINPAG